MPDPLSGLVHVPGHRRAFPGLDDPSHSVTCRPAPRRRDNQACLEGGMGLPAWVAELFG